MLELRSINISNDGKRVDYDYSLSNTISKYFSSQAFYVQYNIDISSVPKSILLIPLLTNILPISWFVGFDIFVDELDEDFLNSILKIKEEFKKLHPERIKKSKLHFQRKVKNTINGNEKALLFSGGVDTYASFLAHKKEKLSLITVWGADIPINDSKQWNYLMEYMNKQSIIKDNPKYFIKANLREFYTFEMELLVDIGWWGKVQHGLALLGIIAPLSKVKGIKEIIIASSYTDDIKISWGSLPQIDEQLTWSGVHILHDGYHMKRQDKVDFIVKQMHKDVVKTPIRVCYSELNQGLNCSKCEKCYRTIIGIILAGDDPNDYGFRVDEGIYDEILNKFEKSKYTKGTRYFWKELMEKANKTQVSFFNTKKEKLFFNKLADGTIDLMLKRKIEKSNALGLFLYKLRNRFPTFYNSLKKTYRLIKKT